MHAWSLAQPPHGKTRHFATHTLNHVQSRSDKLLKRGTLMLKWWCELHSASQPQRSENKMLKKAKPKHQGSGKQLLLFNRHSLVSGPGISLPHSGNQFQLDLVSNAIIPLHWIPKPPCLRANVSRLVPTTAGLQNAAECSLSHKYVHLNAGPCPMLPPTRPPIYPPTRPYRPC